MKRLLILGGTAEAAALARDAVQAFGTGLDVTTSLAGRLPATPALSGRVRVGGFGGTAGLVGYLEEGRTDLLVDATHPFAVVISSHAADACAGTGVPRLVLSRPAWKPEPGDRWLDAADLEEAAARLPGLARRVFLATGPRAVEAFARCSGVWFLVRAFSPPTCRLPLSDFEALVQRPPFTREGETALMTRWSINALVTKNSGGPTDAKLAAARDLRLPVVMVQRPPPPPGDHVHTVTDAMRWLRDRV